MKNKGVSTARAYLHELSFCGKQTTEKDKCFPQKYILCLTKDIILGIVERSCMNQSGF